VIWRKIIAVLSACLCVSTAAANGQEELLGHSATELHWTTPQSESFDETVIPITKLKLGLGLEAKFGTGFCLDFACRFIATNYHVAKMTRLHTIGGEKVIHEYLGTGPDDQGATVNDAPADIVDLMRHQNLTKYTLSRDLAIFELRHSLPHHHGVAFSLRELQEGQAIDIYAYPKEAINPSRKLLQFHGTFKGRTTTGLLAFDYALNANRAIRPGASGGIVVDTKSQQIVGILNGIAKNGDAVALAVPVQSLLELLTKVEPYLAQNIFPSTQGISAVSSDLYPKYVPTSAKLLQQRIEEAPEVQVLRSKAQILADSMRNFIAVQTVVWGAGDKEPTAQAAYEVRVVDGYQRFRSYPDGKKLSSDIPFPSLNHVMRPGGEWAELPGMVGTELRLKIHQAPDVVVDERRMKVFQYWADVEDNVCSWTDITDLVVFSLSHDFTVACYGEVWTDENINIMRISEHYELTGKWKDFQGVVTYGWLQRPGELRLIPLTISTQAETHKKAYWCRGQFTNYRIFSAQARIVADQSAMSRSGVSQPVE
jgi:hypothetical protein